MMQNMTVATLWHKMASHDVEATHKGRAIWAILKCDQWHYRISYMTGQRVEVSSHEVVKVRII